MSAAAILAGVRHQNFKYSVVGEKVVSGSLRSAYHYRHHRSGFDRFIEMSRSFRRQVEKSASFSRP